MKTAIIPISDEGRRIADVLKPRLGARLLARGEVGRRWRDYDAFIFVGALGICVRTIAPFVKDKHTDPAVVCVDSLGKNAISVLSGHVGGANELTRTVSGILDAHEVITTQSDLAGLWALDTFEKRFDWESLSSGMNEVIAAFVNRKSVALFIATRTPDTDYLVRTRPDHVTLVSGFDEIQQGQFEAFIVVSCKPADAERILDIDLPFVMFLPKVMTVGFGLAHQAAPAREIFEAMIEHVAAVGREHDILWSYCTRWCTIDVKRNEPFVRSLRRRGHKVTFFTAEELAQIEVPNPSDTVAAHVGTPSVSEAAAILGSNHGKLVLPKVKGPNWTAAIALAPSPSTPHIEIVGAGPGDPDLVSVRGRKFLEKADLILYAGSLVPKALTECHKPGAVVRSSADMSLDEQCELMRQHYERGHLIVRLHTGDPCIFGAIEEQMAYFDAHGMSYHITPGISSFLAAAAELRSQFTIPERTQTIILTRGEGRTPMPEREQLRLLARSQSTMCIFLSASIVDDVQAQLLEGGYPPETPVAACYHLTWPDQRIYRGQLRDLARLVRENHLTLTTMLVVGDAIDNRQGASRLYDATFTHLFREGHDS